MGFRDRLRRLEQEAEGLYEVLILEDGTKIRYESGEKLEVLYALLDGREHWLLPFFRGVDTLEGMPGLVRALEGGADGT
jgi:hypothetical protein